MGVVDDFKSVVSIVQKIDNVELYRRILDLQSEVVGLFGENLQLKNQLSEVQAKLDLQQKLRFEVNAYWIGDTIQSSDGPFCSNCWDAKRKLVRLHTLNHNVKWSECPTCERKLRMPRRENSFDHSEDDENSSVRVGLPRTISLDRF
jgi:hypothetical protein